MRKIYPAILDWHAIHGRSELPWQGTRDHYKIWVSEIMLQQTQVATVIPYYQQFLNSYPNIKELANANINEVLHLWTGLGYYARGRNLHKAAIAIVDQHNGIFPSQFSKVLALPGIGRSTAGAILAFAENQHHAILDGNVKRVLSRFYKVAGWYGSKGTADKLWALAEQNTPTLEVARYTQAIMDFGATFCKRSKPKCTTCPLQNYCGAFKSDQVREFPEGKPKKTKPIKETFMLLIRNAKGEYLLQQNPPSGIWGGLWGPPQVSELNAEQLNEYHVTDTQALTTFKHTFSHYHLMITPVETKTNAAQEMVTEYAEQVWYNVNSTLQIGLAAPVKKLLKTHSAQS